MLPRCCTSQHGLQCPLMNTSAHFLLSFSCLTNSTAAGKIEWVIPASIGALLPDAPMFLFYAVEKIVLRTPERDIWNTRYFLSGWQDFFDVFNSIPIVLLGLVFASLFKKKWMVVLFLSMSLHFAFDLPLHHDDGHRHFWPLSDWRYESPVSYWDPRHFGKWAASLEAILCAVSFYVSYKRFSSKKLRAGLLIALAIQIAAFSFVIASS